MVAACGPTPLPTHANPPGPASSPGPHDNPPAPAPPPTPTTGEPATPTEPTTGGAAPVEPPHKNPPAPQAVKEPAKYEQKWTVMKFKGNADCQAMVDVTCPKGEPGKPMPTCNPPPPIKYACPSGFQQGDTLKIVLRVGATDCFADYGPTKCPDGVKCNPPPPRKVACPER